MKATGIVRRIDDLGRVVIPKEIRRTMRIREGDPLLMTLTNEEIFILGILKLGERMGIVKGFKETQGAYDRHLESQDRFGST